MTESGEERLSASPPSPFCFVSVSGRFRSLSLTSSPSLFQGKESGCSLNEEHCDLIGCLLSLQRTADLTLYALLLKQEQEKPLPFNFTWSQKYYIRELMNTGPN